ncbi:MFS general substrate transporter [Trichoderma pleuroticola]
MRDLIRKAPIGQLLRLITRNRLLKYPEEEAGFKPPDGYIAQLNPSEKHNDSASIGREGDDVEHLGRTRTTTSVDTAPYSNERLQAEREIALQRTKSIVISPQKTADGIVLNWSRLKRYFVLFVLCFYTWTGIQHAFHVSPVASTLGLGLYVLAYSIGDLLFAPLSEIPSIGRNHIYYLTYIIYWVLSFPEAVVNGFGGLLALRFWLGFFGSPALANGGATVGDMFSLMYIPFGLSWWVFSAWASLAIGPVIGGFAAQAKGWRWPMWETVWMSSFALVFLLLFMPETSAPTIMLRRARRLRKLTGDSRLQSQSEIHQRHMSTSAVLFDALVKPMEIMMKDPAIFFVNLYTGYFYGVFYTFFEVFPLVFSVMHGFNLGQTGLTFLSCLVGVIIGLAAYFAYLQFYMVPDNIKRGFREQEHRLVPAIIGSFLLPIGLFIFAWTANPSIHWVIPLIGSLFIYIPLSYPKYAASLFARNSIWRSGIAGGAVVFSRPLFINLGVDKGVTVFAGLSVMGIFGTVAIYIFGKRLRARSKFAHS